MLKKRGVECPELVANDGTRLREMLDPDNEGLNLPYSLAVAELGPDIAQVCRDRESGVARGR